LSGLLFSVNSLLTKVSGATAVLITTEPAVVIKTAVAPDTFVSSELTENNKPDNITNQAVIKDFVDAVKVELELKDFKTSDVPSTGTTANKFFQALMSKYSVKELKDLVKIIIDLARYHYSPSPTNHPGFKMTVKFVNEEGATAEVEVEFEEGKNSISLDRGKGMVLCYTNACAFSAAVFKEIFVNSTNEECKNSLGSIPGFQNGVNQYFGMVKGFSEADQENAEKAFDQWISQTGLEKRDDKIDKRIKSAAKQTIRNRAKGSIEPAMNFLE
jgi:hypothetical protein